MSDNKVFVKRKSSPRGAFSWVSLGVMPGVWVRSGTSQASPGSPRSSEAKGLPRVCSSFPGPGDVSEEAGMGSSVPCGVRIPRLPDPPGRVPPDAVALASSWKQLIQPGVLIKLGGQVWPKKNAGRYNHSSLKAP